MGPENLRSGEASTIDDFWSQLPITPDSECVQAILRGVTLRVASVLSVPVPEVFLGGALDDRVVQLLELLSPEECTPDVLGVVWERLMAPADRRIHGSHFTPPLVASTVCALALEHLELSNPAEMRVWDPSAGGGAFLLAAARALDVATGLSRPEIIDRLYASDIDSVALEVCVASLSLWSGTGTGLHTFCGDALVDLPSHWPPSFDVIVGNPPFLSQLSADTTRDSARRERLVEAYSGIATGYVDECGLFVHLAISRLASPGVAALVLPESVLAARDARPMREWADRAAAVRTLWIADHQSFDAAVDVVAPVFVVPRSTHTTTNVMLGSTVAGSCETPVDGAWAPLLARARGVPPLAAVAGDTVVGDLASVTAGFRQHFYGLAGAVGEATPAVGPAALEEDHPLVTSGAIEPLRLCWGDRPVKFSGQVWQAPVVQLEEIADQAVRQWFVDRTVPKLLIASQTKVLEVVADPVGTLLPSVPVLSLEPDDDEDLWHLAAVLSSPWASAWYAGRSAGSGLSHKAVRVRASELSKIPTPTDQESWNHGAIAARRAHAAASDHDGYGYQQALRDLAEMMGAAYGGVDLSVNRWWWDRIRMPEHFTSAAY